MSATDKEGRELKPCPFCGGKSLYEVYHTIDGFTQPAMFCNWCKALFSVEGSEDWGIDGMDRLRAAWNRRVATLGNDGVGRTNDGVAERERESCGKDAEQGERAEPSERESYATLRRTTTRNTTRTVYGNKRPICEVCGYGIGDRRWHYCPKCGAEVVE